MAGFRKVTAVIDDEMGAFSFGTVVEFFGQDHTDIGAPKFDFALAAAHPGMVRSQHGLNLMIEHGPERIAESDLVVLLPWETWPTSSRSIELVSALRTAYENGATILSCCTGALLLAEAGLLEGKRVTTHWRWANELAERFPSVDVDPNVLYIDEGRIISGAGGSASVDVLLYLFRREYGARVAAAMARELVVPPHREGGQAQYILHAVSECSSDPLKPVLDWARAHLDQDLTVEVLAAKALMSPRSFARHFKAATGTTPRAWLLAERLQRVEELLETGDLPIEDVARAVGFGTTAALREQFVRRRGVPPSNYRRVFRSAV